MLLATRNQYFCSAAESGATSSITVLDNSCNEYYSCAYTSGPFNIYAVIVIEFTVIFVGSMPLAFHLDTTGTATISGDACTGVYAYVGFNLFRIHA
jgi:hypothetical protein